MKRSASPAFGPLVIKLTSNIKGIRICLDDTFKIWVDLPFFSKLNLAGAIQGLPSGSSRDRIWYSQQKSKLQKKTGAAIHPP